MSFVMSGAALEDEFEKHWYKHDETSAQSQEEHSVEAARLFQSCTAAPGFTKEISKA